MTYRPRFRVTYDIVTPESAENGDVADHGFMQPGHWRLSLIDGPEDFTTEETYMTLREAMRLCYPQEDSGRWFSEIDGRQDYATGAVETRSLHPPKNITPASYRRLARLLRVR